MDKNGDGKLSREELIEEYQKILDPVYAEEVADTVLRSVDTDNNGHIDYSEFLKATLDTGKLFSQRNLKAAFQKFDRDGSGKISAIELRGVLEDGLNVEDEI